MKNNNIVPFSSQQQAWNDEYENPQFLSLDSEPQQDIVRFVRWLKKEGKEVLGRDVLMEWPFVLDLGCGTGRNLNYFVEEFDASGRGYDISPRAIAYAEDALRKMFHTHTEAPYNAQYEVRSIADPYTIPDASVDIVLDITASNSLYEGERTLYMREVRRVLKKDGIMCIRTLCRDGDRNAQNLLKQFPGPEHDTYILPDRGIMERVFTEKDFRELYGKDFEILVLQKQKGYQRWGNQSFKRRYIIAYMRLL